MNRPSSAWSFTKMEGAGNDYVVLRPQPAVATREQVSKFVAGVCDRRFGVGADGVLLVEPGAGAKAADAIMSMWNADGSVGKFCGNGARCAAWFARDQGMVGSDQFVLATDAGEHQVTLAPRWDGDAKILGATGRPERACHLVVGDALVADQDEPLGISLEPYLKSGESCVLRRVDVGNPHAVIFLPAGDLSRWPVGPVGAALQGDSRFPGGVNVEFAVVEAPNRVAVRTVERGCGETWACGSGAVAAVSAAWATNRMSANQVWVGLRGGVLRVSREQSGLVLSGPVRTVFHGTVPISSASR